MIKYLVLAAIVAYASADTCIHCICLHESGCKPLGCHMDVGSLSCGYYQPGKTSGESTETAWKKCSDDYSCATKCVENYYNRYKGNCASTGEGSCQIMARNHNGGPSGCKYSGTEGYWTAIKRCCGCS